MATTVAQETEIADMKAEYGKECRVLYNVGALASVVDVHLRDVDIKVKFQVEASYPDTAVKVVVVPRGMMPADLDDLHQHLDIWAKRLVGKPAMAAILEATKQWCFEHNFSAADMKPNCSTNAKKKSENRRMERQRKAEQRMEEETKNMKKAPMKTSIDVISRIRWDSSLEENDFTIGYLDRILGVVEKKFTSFSWEDVASVDYNTLAIPKHRIQYFKYKDVKVWDKNERLDDVFGSQGGLTILDVIEAHQQMLVSAGGGTAGPAAAAEEGSDDDSTERYYDGSDDDDDGITIDTGYDETRNDSTERAEAKQLPDDTTPVWDAEDVHNPVTSESPADYTWKAEDSYWGPKARPTHFLAVRITNPDIMKAVDDVLQTTLEIEPSYTKCIIPTERLHVTVACLGLDTDDQVAKAVRALHDVKSELVQNWHPEHMQLTLKDIGNFFHNVLYAKVEDKESKFSDFVHHIRASFSAEGVEIRDIFDFTPHMTLVKLKRQVGREVLHTKFLDQRLFDIFADRYFGSQLVDNLYLCEMSENREDSGFYISPAHIKFP